MRKRVLSVVLVCLLVAGVMGCGKQEVWEEPSVPETTMEETTEAIKLSENAWGVEIERIDLEKPENKHYIKWAKKKPNWYNTRTYSKPKYFDVDAYLNQADNEPYPRSWNETKELVVQSTNTSEWEGYTELLVRDTVTGETECIDKGGFADFDGVVFDPVVILSDTQILYHRWYWDGGSGTYYLYDLAIGERILVSDNYGGLCDLGDGQYLWCDDEALYQVDAYALKAGEKNAKRTLVRCDSNYVFGDIHHLSSDKCFVYVNIYNRSDSTWHRGVYDVETGEQVAFFEIPVFTSGNIYNYVLIDDDLEYVYNWAGNVDDPTIHTFIIIHYNQTGG